MRNQLLALSGLAFDLVDLLHRDWLLCVARGDDKLGGDALGAAGRHLTQGHFLALLRGGQNSLSSLRHDLGPASTLHQLVSQLHHGLLRLADGLDALQALHLDRDGDALRSGGVASGLALDQRRHLLSRLDSLQ